MEFHTQAPNDFHLLNRVRNILGYCSPEQAMSRLVEEGFSPERAHIIICAAELATQYNLPNNLKPRS